MRKYIPILCFLLLCAAVSVFSTTSVYGAVVNDLMLHWTFDDTANPLKDVTGNGYDLTFSGDAGTPYSTDTPTGAGQSYSPVNYGVVATSTFAEAIAMPNYTISYWIKADSPNANYNVIRANDGWGVYNSHSFSDGNVYVGQDVPNRVEIAGLYDTGAWTQFTYTYENGKGSVYKNGTLVCEHVDAGAATRAAWTSFSLGQSGNDNIHGKVDDVSIWSSALSANSVKVLAANAVTAEQLAAMPAELATPTANALANGVISWGKSADGYATLILQDNPIAYWRMNEAAGATEFADATGYGHNMGNFNSVAPGAGINVSGNSCAQFTHAKPNARAQFDTENKFDLKDGFSVEYWLNPSSFASNPEFTANADDGWASGFDMHTWLNVGKLYVGQTVNSRIEPGNQANPLNLNEWNHVVYTFDGTTGSLYFDGELAATKALAQNMDWDNLWINNVDGFLSDMAIYDYALTANQVWAHYSEATGVPEPASWTLLLLSIFGLGAYGVRKSSKKEIKV